MKYKSIFKLCLLTTFLSVATISCDDWTEMEIHDSQVNGFKEQNPQEYAAYTQNLRAYKATKHAVVYARLDNAPEVSTGEKDFLRALPDSIDIVTMRNADRLSEYDREDMKLVREDYGTKVLYYIDCTAKDKLNTSITSAVEAVRTGTFDGLALGSEGSAVDVSALKSLLDALGQTPCLLVFVFVTVLNTVLTLLVISMPTIVLLVIYFLCRRGMNRKKQIEKMNIQDL